MLRATVARLSGGDAALDAELGRQGVVYGASETLRQAEAANRHPPELRTHDRRGERVDQVDFHPGWHHMMALARRQAFSISERL